MYELKPATIEEVMTRGLRYDMIARRFIESGLKVAKIGPLDDGEAHNLYCGLKRRANKFGFTVIRRNGYIYLVRRDDEGRE